MIIAQVGSNKKIWDGELERYFSRFRKHVVGHDQMFATPYGYKTIEYADWTASGRLYKPIEEKINQHFAPFMANTHTESNQTGMFMTNAYLQAKMIIKEHVNAGDQDVLLLDGFGMTSVMNKFQRILGIRIPGKWKEKVEVKPEERPVVFITHREHHSNQITWMETISEVVVIEPAEDGSINLSNWEKALKKYSERKMKIGAFTACSNVTGLMTPYYELARLMHEYGGICVVDFAASAPYININMNPEDKRDRLDAIMFSPHKFLGGPGTSGVLIFNSALYDNPVPDHPGGGTVKWTNPWGSHSYHHDIETREDGGTPGILQCIRTALCIRLKEEMGVDNMLKREKELLDILLPGLKSIPEVQVLEPEKENRLGIISFTVRDMHYNLVVKLLNDRFGIQVRGGCSCAGTYGHYLMQITYQESKKITDEVEKGNYSTKPGWVRYSIHPIMTNKEAYDFIRAMQLIVENREEWQQDYIYDPETNDYFYCHHTREDFDWFFHV